MRRLLPTALALSLAACSRAPEVNLPESTRGLPLEEEARHSLVVDAAGRVTVDGAPCATAEEVQDALERAARSMRQDSMRAARFGLAWAPDEILVVRIDRAARFEAAADPLMTAAARGHIVRLRMAVVDPRSRDERFLRIHAYDEFSCIDLMWDWSLTDSKLEAGRASVDLWLEARSPLCPQPSNHHPDAPWGVMQLPPTEELYRAGELSWEQACEIVAQRRKLDVWLSLFGEIGSDAPWQEAVGMLDRALDFGVERFVFGAHDVDVPVPRNDHREPPTEEQRAWFGQRER